MTSPSQDPAPRPAPAYHNAIGQPAKTGEEQIRDEHGTAQGSLLGFW